MVSNEQVKPMPVTPEQMRSGVTSLLVKALYLKVAVILCVRSTMVQSVIFLLSNSAFIKRSILPEQATQDMPLTANSNTTRLVSLSTASVLNPTWI